MLSPVRPPQMVKVVIRRTFLRIAFLNPSVVAQSFGIDMNAKRLSQDSEYAQYDADGDGIVTDEELEVSKELQELHLAHERADAQRSMSWFALWGMLLYPSLVVVSSWVGLTQAATILGDMASVYFVSVAGILAAFFGAQAWSNKK